MRLIDADELKKELCQDWFLDILLTQRSKEDMFRVLAQKIDGQPTSYDVDWGVEQLEKLKKANPFINGIRDNSIEAAASRQTLDYAIEIVKKGGE